MYRIPNNPNGERAKKKPQLINIQIRHAVDRLVGGAAFDPILALGQAQVTDHWCFFLSKNVRLFSFATHYDNLVFGCVFFFCEET